MDRYGYEIMRQVLADLYSDDDNVNEGSGLTKFEKASKSPVLRSIDMHSVFKMKSSYYN